MTIHRVTRSWNNLVRRKRGHDNVHVYMCIQKQLLGNVAAERTPRLLPNRTSRPCPDKLGQIRTNFSKQTYPDKPGQSATFRDELPKSDIVPESLGGTQISITQVYHTWRCLSRSFAKIFFPERSGRAPNRPWEGTQGASRATSRGRSMLAFRSGAPPRRALPKPLYQVPGKSLGCALTWAAGGGRIEA